MAQVQCIPQRGSDGIGFTNYWQNVAAMKSEKPLLRLASSATQGGLSGLDDNARFADVVMPHIDDAYRLAHWLTGNSTDAEDVVQDASLRAFRAIRGYAGGSARAWLLSIVRNTAYSWLRTNRPTAVVTVDDLEAVELAQANPSSPDAQTPETTLLAQIDDAETRTTVEAERAFLAALDAGCTAPVGALARIVAPGVLSLEALAALTDDGDAVRVSGQSAPGEGPRLGRELAAAVLCARVAGVGSGAVDAQGARP